MVSYDDIFKAYLEYEKEHDCHKWCDLWMLCNTRMGALVKMKAAKLKVPLTDGDIDNVIMDSVIYVMASLKEKGCRSTGEISKTFWFENLRAFKEFNRIMKKWQRLDRAAGIANSLYFKSGLNRKTDETPKYEN